LGASERVDAAAAVKPGSELRRERTRNYLQAQRPDELHCAPLGQPFMVQGVPIVAYEPAEQVPKLQVSVTVQGLRSSHDVPLGAYDR
jgi:hypothetical protein